MSEYDFLDAFDEDDAPAKPKHAAGHDDFEAPKRRGIASHLPELLVAIVLTALLAIVPLVAHAATDEADSNAQSQTASSAQAGQGESAEASSQASSKTKSQSKSEKAADGLAAPKAKTVFAKGKAIRTSADGARGLAASHGGVILAGDLQVSTKGKAAGALAVDDEKSHISLVSSKLATAAEESPLIAASGALELDNVKGTAKAAPIAELKNAAGVLVSNCRLKSGYAGAESRDGLAEGITSAVTSGTTDAVSGAIVIYGTDDTVAGKGASGIGSAAKQATGASSATSANPSGSSSSTITALFQAAGSTIESDIESGALFYLTNTQAKVTLFNTSLDFDSEKANLISVAGNNVEGWGTAGKNGANAIFTCYDEQLSGNVSVDAMSTLDFFLLNHSSWNGSSAIQPVASGETATSNLNVNIDATSGWTLSESSTVTNLNLEPGGKLVDENGDAVKIVDADGNTLVDGASDIAVKVQGSFSTAVTTTNANDLEESIIDRTEYDDKYGSSTAFGSNGEPTTPTVEDEARKTMQLVLAWFKK